MQNLQLRRAPKRSPLCGHARVGSQEMDQRKKTQEKQHGQAILSTKLIQEIHGNSRLRRIILDRPGMSQESWRLRKKPGFIYIYILYIIIWLVVSTPLKNISQIGSSSQLTIGENKNCSKPPTSYMYVYIYIYNINK